MESKWDAKSMPNKKKTEKRHAKIRCRTSASPKQKIHHSGSTLDTFFGQARGKGVDKYKQILADQRVIRSRSAP